VVTAKFEFVVFLCCYDGSSRIIVHTGR